MKWLKEWQWFSKADTLQLFLFLLLNASEEDKYHCGIRLRRGQIITSISHLCEALGSTPRKVRTSIERLTLSHDIDKQTTNKNTILTICDYDSYIGFFNDVRQTNDKQTTNKRQTDKENFPPTPPLKENIIYNPLTLAGEPPLKKTPKEIFDEVVDMWHAICVDLPQVRVRNATRQKKVLCRVSEMGGYEKALPVIEDVFRTAQSISFYKGDNNRGWKASFDWFFENDTNWAKVLERVHQNGQRTYTNSNTEQARIIQERREQHLHDIERIQSDYLSKIGR